MAEFKVINTQEEFDERIKERITRAENKIRDEFKGWTSPDALKALKETHEADLSKLKETHAEELKKYEGYDEKFTAQNTKIRELEIGALKTKVAHSKNLPWDAIDFLQGEDEKTISESADRLSKLSAQRTVFTRNTEESAADSKDLLWRDLAERLPKKGA